MSGCIGAFARGSGWQRGCHPYSTNVSNYPQVPKRRNWKRWAVYPAGVFTFLFFVLPLTAMVVVSFWTRDRGGLNATWTAKNYITFFGRDYLVESLYNSVEVTLISTAISVLLAYPLAYILAYRVPRKWQALNQTAGSLDYRLRHAVLANRKVIVWSCNPMRVPLRQDLPSVDVVAAKQLDVRVLADEWESAALVVSNLTAETLDAQVFLSDLTEADGKTKLKG